MNVQTLRMTLGWSPEKLARESGVAVASVYLVERMGTAGPEDDSKIEEALQKGIAERSQLKGLGIPEC